MATNSREHFGLESFDSKMLSATLATESLGWRSPFLNFLIMETGKVITTVIKKRNERKILIVKNEGETEVSTFGHVTTPGHMSSYEQNGALRVDNKPNLVFISNLPAG